MATALTCKLGAFTTLSAADCEMLDDLCAGARDVPAGRDLIREGDLSDQSLLVVEGWACRYKLLPGGARQILAFLIPGDIGHSHCGILGATDHSIGTISKARIAFLSRSQVVLAAQRPSIGGALTWALLVESAISREWLANIGRRAGRERLAHFLCEMRARMLRAGFAADPSIWFPLTQEQLGDALGLTSVHVNRLLHELRASGLISLGGKLLTIHQLDRLIELAQFSPTYLHAPVPARAQQ
jgi:CRP-like cAMP-binding protein